MRSKSVLVLLFLFPLSYLLSLTDASADPGGRDLQMERFLLEARIVSVEKMIRSTTYPMVLNLELDGTTGRAVFKYRDDRRASDGPARSAAAEHFAAHGYRHEVAAYRLDRLLSLEMVPVAVLRVVKTDGALIQWIAEASSEKDLRERGERVSDSRLLRRQRAVMNLFDALIQNPDRRESDQLVAPGTSKLHLIDHGRAFGASTVLPESFTGKPASLPRKLLDKLEQLDEPSLREQLGDLLIDAEFAVLLERRDAILMKIAADRRRYGDSKVFQD
jgi:hypothetical protein